MMRDKITNSFLIVGTAIFILAFLILFLSSMFFLYDYTISNIIFVLSFVTSIIYCLILSKKLIPESGFKNSSFIAAFFVLTIIMSAVISSAFYDNSWDGQVYHQKAIYYLAKNWNPYKGNIGDIWLDHYAKGPWIYAASIYKLVGHIEVSKTFNIAFIIGSFLISSATLISIKKIKITYAYLISFIAAFNPVSIYQSLSFYIDGQLSSLLVTLASILYLCISTHTKNLYTLLLIPIIVLLVNIKFTGLIYSVIIIAAFFIYFFVYSKKHLYRFTLISLASLFLAVFLIGYNPYVLNTQTHGNPFYPLAGDGSVDIMTMNTPIGLNGKNKFNKLFISIFSKPGTYLSDKYKSNQIPLQTFATFKGSGVKEQISMFTTTDTRISGFGIFFGIIFILSTFLTFALLISRMPKEQHFLASITILWLTVLANPEFWWARYVPQLWLFPILPTIFSLSNPRIKKSLTLFLTKSIIFIAILNIISIGVVYTRSNIYTSHDIKLFISKASKLKQPVFISSKDFFALRIRLEENKIDYRLVNSENLPCLHTEAVPSALFSFCSVPSQKQRVTE